MDSDSIFYYIFIGGVLFFSFLNSRKKAKAEKEKREQELKRQEHERMSNPPSLKPQQSEQEQFDNWFNDTDNEESVIPVPTSLNDILEGIRKSLQQNAAPNPVKPQMAPKVEPRLATSTKNSPLKAPEPTPQPAIQRSIVIEPPEMEGQRVTKPQAETDDAYTIATDVLPASSRDWRKAIIAHEILKRKF